MKSKLNSLLLAIALLFLAGCQTVYTNLTPERVPANPSNIYTISFTTNFSDGAVVDDSIEAFITIDGKRHRMAYDADGIFKYEYKMPRERNKAKYFYELEYAMERNTGTDKRFKTSELYELQLMNRYVVNMQSERGPVGAQIPVLGRGFDALDRVIFGGVEAETQFASPVALSFTIPALPADKAYPVSLMTGKGEIPIGVFIIDASELSVVPTSIQVESGTRTVLLFRIEGQRAPAGGLYVDVTTDVPSSVIMPEVLIPGGHSSVSIQVEGGEPGQGRLFVSAKGFREFVIPITVTGEPTKTEETAAPQPKFDPPPPAVPSSSGEPTKVEVQDDVLIVE